ncbi:hypothetical protein Tco_0731427 [Tanacetum coccineum]
MGELTFFLGLQVKQKADGIFISQDKYVAEILKKFDFANVKTASTPIETQKPLVKDEEASDVDVHLYRSMIGSLMYLTASRPDIMFAVCACSRFQVTPKSSHLSAVKRIFRYLKGKPKLGLWYPRVSSFDLESYSDSDYAGANLDRKSTTGGCQFLGRRLISWQCKKQTIVATSTTEAEYVAAASCCGQVLWIQNQMLDYGFNFMNTKIYIDNESTICIVKNPVYHSKTKHIAIRHHFIRDAYEKKLIQVLKIHTDDNVADLLTKAFDVSRESLRRVFDGTEALLLPTLFILWLATVSTDSAKLVPLGKVCTAIETLKKNTAKALISLSTTITLSNTMAVLESCPKHNMVAYLEKTDGNAEFHEIIDFLTRSSIHHALTVSPVVSTTFVEQFWTSAKSKIINNVRHITAKVAGKPVSISEDYNSQPTPSPAHTSEAPFEPHTDSSPVHTSEVPIEQQKPSPSTIIPDSIPETSGGNLGVSDQAKEIQHLKAQIKKLKKQAKPVIKHHRAWMRSISLKQRLARKRSSKKQWVHKESVSKQGRKFAKVDFIAEEVQTTPRREQFTIEVKEQSSFMTQLRIQALYEKIKRSDEDFISIGSAEDERLIKRMNEKGIDSSKSEVIKEESKEEVQEENDSEKENDELRLHLTIAPDEEKEVDYEILDRKYPIKEWKTECLGTKPQADKAEHLEEINQNVVIRSNGQKRYFSTLMRVLSIFDREDLNAVYQLVMDRYQDEIPEGFDRVLWGDLMVMFNPDDENEFWNSQQDWNIVSWKLHGSSGVHTLVTETGLVIHMLVEKKYPLRKKVLVQMLKLKLESKEDSTMALELIRFIKKLLAELEPEDFDGDEEDL